MDGLKIATRAGLLVGVSGLLLGLYVFYRQQVYFAKQYCYKIANIRPVSFSTQSIKFNITIKILNRSSFSMLINSYDLKVYINDAYLTNIRSNELNTVNPNSVSYITSLVDVKPSNVLQSNVLLILAANYISDKSKIKISVKGNVSIKSSFLSKQLPIEYSDNLQALMSSDKSNNDRLTCPKDF